MKFLKLFNENRYIYSNRSYKRVDPTDWVSLSSSKREEKFSNSEIEDIDKFKSIDRLHVLIENNIIKVFCRDFSIHVEKREDEWYYIYYNLDGFEYFECDQFHGVIEFIEDQLLRHGLKDRKILK